MTNYISSKTVGVPETPISRSAFALCTISSVAFTIIGVIALSLGGSIAPVISYSMIGAGGLTFVLAALACIKKKPEKRKTSRDLPSYGDLPTETLCNIFGKLPPAALPSCSEVCLSWNAALIGDRKLFSMELIENARQAACNIMMSDQCSQILAKVALAAAEIGSIEQARDITGEISDLSVHVRIQTLAKVAIVAFQMDKIEIAQNIIDEAIDILHQNSDNLMLNEQSQAEVLAEIAKAAAMTGNSKLAQDLISETKNKVLEIDAVTKSKILTEAAKAAALIGDIELVKQLGSLTLNIDDLYEEVAKAVSIKNIGLAKEIAFFISKKSFQRSKALVEIVRAAIDIGDIELALEMAFQTKACTRCEALIETAKAATQKGKPEFIPAIIKQTKEFVCQSKINPAYLVSFLAEMALIASHEDMELSNDLLRLASEELIPRIGQGSFDLVKALAQIAKATAQLDDKDTAKKIIQEAWDIALKDHQEQIQENAEHLRKEAGRIYEARFINPELAIREAQNIDNRERIALLAEVAKGANLIGDSETAQTAIEQARHYAFQSSSLPDTDLIEVAEGAAQSGNIQRAFDIANEIDSDYYRNNALLKVAKGAAQIGDIQRALDILLPKDIFDPYERERILAKCAESAAKNGNIRQVHEIITQHMVRPYFQASAFVEVAKITSDGLFPIRGS